MPKRLTTDAPIPYRLPSLSAQDQVPAAAVVASRPATAAHDAANATTNRAVLIVKIGNR